ncbi:MAG: Spy/CpxP family protein refolding chaperone [Candidatus Ratteibacteria bacterium]
MKKIILIAAALMLTKAYMVLAADLPAGKGLWNKGKSGQEMKRGPGEIGLGLYSQLNLTEEQKAKIQEIQKSRRDQLSALKEDTTLSHEQKREKMRTIMESTQKQMDEILTPEQKQKLDQLREQMRERLRQHQEKIKENKPSEQPAK